MTDSFLIQGLAVNLHCDQALFPGLSAYLSAFCRGDNCLGKKALDLKIKICDTPFPLPPDAVKEVTGPWITYFSRGDTLYFISRDGSLIYLDPVRREAKGFLTQDILKDPLSSFIFACEPLAEMFKYSGLYCLHAACLRNGDTSIILSGESGSGKTTTSLSLVAHGFKYVSDDTLLIEKSEDGVTAYPLYKSFNIDRNTAMRFPQLFKNGPNPIPEKGKKSIDISKIIPDSHIRSAKPDVIVFLKIISGAKSKMQPLGHLEVYKRLLSQIIIAIDKNVAKNQLDTLGRLVKQTRGFELLSGKDLYENPGLISHFIDEIKNS